jgi:AcrR family transcriptional regulator
MAAERGRPRSFDVDQALEAALRVFWKQGFLNASLSELTAEMGINKPSLYAAFGDKEHLYLAALGRYAERRLSGLARQMLGTADGREAVRQFLLALAALFSDPKLPGGCFIVNGAADCGSSTMSHEVEQALQQALQSSERLLLERLARARDDAQLPEGAVPEALAAFFITTVAGMSVMAKNGAPRHKLEQIVGAAMAVWPSPGPAPSQRSETGPPGSGDAGVGRA